MEYFKNRVVIVTGGGSGIGAALCRALACSGATVVAADIAFDAAVEVVAAIAAAGGRAEARAVDVTLAESVEALIAATVAQHGRLDCLFNNAGIAVTGDARDLDIAHWRRVIEVNLLGVIYGANHAYKQMAKQGHGHIVNIASLAGLLPFPGNAPYAASKHGVVGLSLSLRAEGEALGIKVSTVCPGYIQSNILQATPFVNLRREEVLDRIPFKILDTEIAARSILEGVARNEAVICFPAYARALWRLYRLWPRLLEALNRKTVRDMRKARIVS